MVNTLDDLRKINRALNIDDSYLSAYEITDTPACALPDLHFVAYAAGAVVVALALALVVVKRLRTW